MVLIEDKYSRWYLIYTKPRGEQIAKKNLEDQGYQILLPMISLEKPNQTSAITIDIMFPRYLFVKMNSEKDNWTAIKSTRGVSHLITFGPKLAEVPCQVIKYLQIKCDANGIFRHKRVVTEHLAGDQIKISNGILKGREAVFVSRSSKERVKVLLQLTNHSAVTEMSASDIAQKSTISFDV